MSETHDGRPDKWFSWRDPEDLKDRDSCGGFINFETQYFRVQVPE